MCFFKILLCDVLYYCIFDCRLQAVAFRECVFFPPCPLFAQHYGLLTFVGMLAKRLAEKTSHDVFCVDLTEELFIVMVSFCVLPIHSIFNRIGNLKHFCNYNEL